MSEINEKNIQYAKQAQDLVSEIVQEINTNWEKQDFISVTLAYRHDEATKKSMRLVAESL